MCVRSTLRLWSQQSATVRNRPQPSATVRAIPVWPCLWQVQQKGCLLEISNVLVASFRVAGVALRDIRMCFVTCRKSFVWQAQYFCDVFRRCVAVFVAGAALWTTSITISRGRRSTLDVSCGVVFCESHCQGCVKWLITCKFRGKRGIL